MKSSIALTMPSPTLPAVRLSDLLLRTFLALLLIVAALSPVSAKSASTAADLQQRLQQTVEGLRQANNLPGISAAVVLEDGMVVTAASGQADKEAGTPMTPSTLLLGASTGKTYVAALALRLAEQGKLDLDCKISEWLGNRPWFARLPNGDAITLRMLLNHTSGVPDHAKMPRFWKEGFQDVGPDHLFTPEQLVAYVLDGEPLAPAGTAFNYSDTNYILAGLIIEQATGRDFYGLAAEQFLTPLKLSATRPSNSRDIPGLASAYAIPGGLMPVEKLMIEGRIAYNPANEWTGGGFATTPSNLAQWAGAIFGGRVLQPASLEAMLRPGVPGSTEGSPHYGLGVGVKPTPYGTSYGHTGSMPGYGSAMAYYPSLKLSVAVMANRDEGWDRSAALQALISVVAPPKE